MVVLGLILTLSFLRMLKGKQGERLSFPGYRQVTCLSIQTYPVTSQFSIFSPIVLGLHINCLINDSKLACPSWINGILSRFHIYMADIKV